MVPDRPRKLIMSSTKAFWSLAEVYRIMKNGLRTPLSRFSGSLHKEEVLGYFESSAFWELCLWATIWWEFPLTRMELRPIMGPQKDLQIKFRLVTQMNFHAIQQLFVWCILKKMCERCISDLFWFKTFVHLSLNPVKRIPFRHSGQLIPAKRA